MTDRQISSLTRDARIIHALHVARYALVTHDGMAVTCEGQTWRSDFTQEIEKLDEVMTLLGVDLTEPLPAPMWREGQAD